MKTLQAALACSPATAMGDMIERLRAAGMTWAIEDWPAEAAPP